ncbi:MAG: CDP-glucose 4,6-dehydratase [Acidobacteriota bacterium]
MSIPFADAFVNREIFITGHTGFKGSWLALWLSQLGARVTGYALKPPSEPNNFVVSRVREMLVAHHEGDIRDTERLHSALKQAAPEIIFHLAAQPLVRDSYIAPRETFDVNVMGTACLLDGVRALALGTVVIAVTSDKCYENREQVWGYREIDPMGGYDPYSASKGAAELLIASYRRSFFNPERLSEHGVKLASVRAGNVIGGGDWARKRIITDIVNALTNGEPVPVRNPTAIRPWQHVLEPLCGYLTLAARLLNQDEPHLCSSWNFGPASGEDASVDELVRRFCQIWGGGSWSHFHNSSQPHEAAILRLNIDKACWELGWRPRWRFDEAVARTARWYRRFYDNGGGSMQQTCWEDIAAYQAALNK